ncbi:uncharacterized protein LOC120349556 [Nilaparvata lugens]|uniref:uncharacterized protein LOC120349556 n=1 Tax=Nilaparvata lugens TaxID=108931 RepID=UPI00193DDE61|nr:uncharacterized protein LOC120349556 [Nilaparvata lugens]
MLNDDVTQDNLKPGTDFTDTENSLQMENEIEMLLTGGNEPVKNDVEKGPRFNDEITQDNLETAPDFSNTSSLFNKEEGMTDAQSLPLETSNHDSSDYEPTGSAECSSSDEDNFRSGRKLTRWKSSNKEEWKRNKDKLKRKSGKEYRTKTGLKAGKSPKDVDCNSCRWNCSAMFDSDTVREFAQPSGN